MDIYERISNYSGYLGAAKKEDIYSITAHHLDQQFFPFDFAWIAAGKPAATDYLTQQQLTRAKARDFAFDIKNPRQQIGANPLDVKFIEEIPQFEPEQVDIMTEADYTARDQVQLLQESNLHYTKQENLFIDPELIGETEYNTDKIGKSKGGISQLQLYSFDGSASGTISNRFDEQGYRMNSVESMVAF